MKLVIVESPNKTKTISQFLGSDYKVMASVGHVRDLATSGHKGFGVDIENGFKPNYVVLSNKEETISKLKKEVAKAEEVYLATDPDREGEAISWHLAIVLGLDVKTVKRLTFNAITKKAVLQAMEHPNHINMDLVASQETRRILDRIIGFDLSSLTRSKIKADSAGRVQSVTLKMIVEHQKEIDAFISKNYYDIDAEFGESKLKANLYSYNGETFKPYSIDSEEKLEKIKKELPKTFKVEPLVYTKRYNQPRLPFTTSSLQQEAFTRFNYGVKKTSSLAQRLFEGVEIRGEFKALITYIRTDSTRLAPDFVEVASQFIVNHFGAEYYKGETNKKGKSELVQDAHEAIRPIDLNITPASIKGEIPADMYNLYRLIYARSLASLMKPKEDDVTSVSFLGNNYIFKTDAVKTAFKGYSVIYEELGFPSKQSAQELPQEIVEAASKGEEVKLAKLNIESKTTQPPSKYNDGTVVKLMEEKGIGRPSTYSSTISTLVDREYVTSDKHVLTPTESGTLVVNELEKFFPDLMDYNYTKQMEDNLEKIKEGDASKVQLLSDFYTTFKKEYDYAKSNMEKVPEVETGENCPICGAPLVYRKSRYGQFIGCKNYPKCKYIKREPKVVEEVEGRVCPECGSKLVYRFTKRGEKFIGCSNFPKCKYTENLQGQKTVVENSKEGQPCPKCHEGHLVIKRSKFGPFYACSNHPKCDYTEPLKPRSKKKVKDEN